MPRHIWGQHKENFLPRKGNQILERAAQVDGGVPVEGGVEEKPGCSTHLVALVELGPRLNSVISQGSTTPIDSVIL